MTGRAPLAAKLGLALGATAIVLGAGEWWARVRYRSSTQRLTAESVAAAARTFDPKRMTLIDLIRISPEPDLLFDLKPNLAGTFMAPYRSNEHGMRDEPMPFAKPADRFRVALLGDSIAFGWGLPVEKRFADLLEARFRDAVPGKTLEVLDFGVPGYNTAQEAACLDHLALSFAPDVVLVQFFMNDYFLPNFVWKLPDPPHSYLLARLEEALGKVGPTAATLELPMVPGHEDMHETPVEPWKRDPDLVPDEYRWMVGAEGVKRALVRMKDACDKARIPLAIIVIDNPPERVLSIAPDDPKITGASAEIRAIASSVGVPLIDVLPDLVRLMHEQKLRLKDVCRSDWHPNEKGSELIAEILAVRLPELGLLPAPKR